MLIHKEEVLDTLEKRELDVVITFGAGDIDRLIPSIKELLQNKTR